MSCKSSLDCTICFTWNGEIEMFRLLIAAALLLCPPAIASDLRVIDGDTVEIVGEKIRLCCVDTPEIRGQCEAERRLAVLAKHRVASLMAGNTFSVDRSSQKTDRYGRTIASIRLMGSTLSEILIAEGYGRTYSGGRRSSWCSR